MNRQDFQALAVLRIEEAQILFDAGLYSGAYYLAGYAVECALKACICRKTQADDFPPDRKTLENIYTHNLEKLLRGAELTSEYEQRSSSDQAIRTDWTVVKDWSEEARYSQYGETTAREFLEAITDPASGVLRWLQNYW